MRQSQRHNYRIGTSGWNYDHWKGVFYPKEMPSHEWLGFYARHFDTVEINYSFYHWPEREAFEKWRRDTPEGFVFAVKASQYLTHRKKLKDAQEPLRRTFDHARGLGEKLGPILYQLPPRWKANLDRLRQFLSLLPEDIRHVIEFRDPSWQVEEVYSLLQEHGVGYCIMSAPDLPKVLKVTASFAYVRMHNGGCDTGGNYEDVQLEWWAEQIVGWLRDADVYVYFNNDASGFAVKNALRLREMVGASAISAFSPQQ